MMYSQSHQINIQERSQIQQERLKKKGKSNCHHLVGLSPLFSYRRILLASSELQERIGQSEHHWSEGGNFVPFFLLLCRITCSWSLLVLWLKDGHWDLRLQMPLHCLQSRRNGSFKKVKRQQLFIFTESYTEDLIQLVNTVQLWKNPIVN